LSILHNAEITFSRRYLSTILKVNISGR